MIYPRIRYIGKVVSWRLKGSAVSYEKFDKLVFAAVRKITLNKPSFPTALLETAEEQGGLGITRVSVDCQLAKLADFRRAFTRSQHHSNTMLALLNNILKSTNQPLLSNSVTVASVAHTDTWWLTSALEFLQSLDLTLTCNHSITGTSSTSSNLLTDQFPLMSRTTTAALYLHSIATHQELYMEGDTPSATLQPLIDDLRLEPSQRQPIPLRSDQTWLIYTHGHPYIYQLMGKRGNTEWRTVQWTVAHTPDIGATLTLTAGVNALVGAGGVTSLSEDNILGSNPRTSHTKQGDIPT